MKVADYIIRRLADQGITDIFVVYGAANGDLIDAFVRTDKTRYVAVMHEQAGGFAAEGYAKTSGKFGVAIATSGPGGGNFVTPIQNCFYDSVPCLFITGQINSKFLRPDPSIRQVGFQETDIVGIVRPITKYATMITDAKSVRYELEKAFFLMKEGRPGPVLLDIPLNIQKQDIDPDELEGFDDQLARPVFDLALVDRATNLLVQDLKDARRPCILVGGGVRKADAVNEFRLLAERLRIPVFPTYNALDVATSDWEWYGGRVGTFGGPGRNFGIQNCDLLIAIGSRLSGRITGGRLDTFARGAKRWVVDVDQSLLQRKLQQVPFHGNICCDAKFFIRHFRKCLCGVELPNVSEWTARVMHWKEKYDPVLPEYCNLDRDHVHPYHFFRILSEEMAVGDILIGDCGGNIIASNHAFKTKYGQLNLTNNGNSPMGFSFAGAMGAWLGSDRRRNVVCTIGDGGFNMNLQEIQTVLNYDLGFKTFIIDNRIYGITKQFQETNFEGRMEACGPKGYNPPDFAKICEAYDMPTLIIWRPNEIRESIREVLDRKGPMVCVVNCYEEHHYEPRIAGWKAPIEDMSPYLSREEFRANMIIEPADGWETPE